MTFASTKLLATAAAVAGLALAGCTTTAPTDSASGPAARNSLNAQADAALTRLYDGVQGSRDMVRNSAGVLVCPAVVGGSLVVGVEYGRCVLREGGRSVEYYKTTSLSAGLQAGAQSKAMFYVFNSRDALTHFRTSQGWTAGADATVSVASMGANVGVDTNTIRQPVVGYVMTNQGLEAGVAMSGSKFTKVDM